MSLDLEAVVEFFGADSIGLARSCGEPLRENDRWKMPEKNATDRGVKHKNELLRSDGIFGFIPRIRFFTDRNCLRHTALSVITSDNGALTSKNRLRTTLCVIFACETRRWHFRENRLRMMRDISLNAEYRRTRCRSVRSADTVSLFPISILRFLYTYCLSATWRAFAPEPRFSL